MLVGDENVAGAVDGQRAHVVELRGGRRPPVAREAALVRPGNRRQRPVTAHFGDCDRPVGEVHVAVSIDGEAAGVAEVDTEGRAVGRAGLARPTGARHGHLLVAADGADAPAAGDIERARLVHDDRVKDVSAACSPRDLAVDADTQHVAVLVGRIKRPLLVSGGAEVRTVIRTALAGAEHGNDLARLRRRAVHSRQGRRGARTAGRRQCRNSQPENDPTNHTAPSSALRQRNEAVFGGGR